MVMPLRVVMLEEDAAAAERMEAELRRFGFDPVVWRVRGEEEFVAALAAAPDVILSDYQLSQFDALRALRCLRDRGREIPFLVVANTEACAAVVLEQGAFDCLAKDRLERLGRTVARALEHHKVRAELRDSEARFLDLFELNPLPSWVFDVETLQFLAVNDAAVHCYGYTREEIQALGILGLRPPEEAPRFLDYLKRAPQGRSHAGVWRHRKKNGTLLDMEVYTHALTFAGRTARLAVARDVGEQRRLEENLRQGQKMEAIGRLAGGVAHDFNNLLTVINGYSEILLGKLSDPDPNREIIKQIRKSGDRAAALTHQLLAFSRKQVQELTILDLNAIVADLEKMLRRLIGEDIHLSTLLSPSLGKIKADPNQIEQIIINLALNARDAMPHGGDLIVETRNVDLDLSDLQSPRPDVNPGPDVLLQVRDTGSGMNAEILGHLFEPFFTTKEAGKGTGLGLATVYGIVKQSQGHIEVDSSVGAGSTFRIYLPRCQGVAPLARSHQGFIPQTTGLETVLLVEDEDGVRSLARLSLEGEGYQVLEAEGPSKALHIGMNYPGTIHLLVTDVVMPEMSGRQVADRLVEARPFLKVLYITGYTDEALGRHGVMEDYVCLLQKPFTPASLVRKVREVLDSPAS